MRPDAFNPITALKKSIELCYQKHFTICIAESVTGGRLSSAFTALPGSSKVFREGIVCYTPESKTTRLNIKPEVITQFGLVSYEITLLMAQQIRKKLKADIGIATTGNAGPETNDSLAGVGQTFLAISTKTKEFVLPKVYHGDRSLIQLRLTEDAIKALYVFLMEEEW